MREGNAREELDLQLDFINLNRRPENHNTVPGRRRQTDGMESVSRVIRPSGNENVNRARNPYLSGEAGRPGGRQNGRGTAVRRQAEVRGTSAVRRQAEVREASEMRRQAGSRRPAQMRSRTSRYGEMPEHTYRGTREERERERYGAPAGTREMQRAVSDGESPAQRQARRRRARTMYFYRLAISAAVVVLFAIFTFLFFFGGAEQDKPQNQTPETPAMARPEPVSQAETPWWTEDFLTPNEFSRPGEALPEVNNIFVHYTANQNTSAAQNRSYFEQLKDTGERSASAHFIIGYEGEIIQCIPLDEIAYAVIGRNYDSISIECCYTSEDGSFTQATYDSLVRLLKWLTDKYGLKADDILRHYDSGGKLCPVYYVNNESAWEQLKKDVEK